MRPKRTDGHRPVSLADALAGVLPPDRLAESSVVVMTVHRSEGTVVIEYRWQTVTAAGLAAARRAGPPS
jgi:hypothetical protein